ncbi:MAG: bifunctional riboflavin kinase/FAD synthetase [Cytophagales bacterium]|nr:bifunctional riboflavin kinase/FAD synthetase [Cytophagales bacterium]
MQVHHGLDNLPKFTNPVVTSGTFDGVHKGHQVILQHLKEASKRHKGESIVLTFWPHPRFVISSSSQNLKLLNTLDEKISLLTQQNIDHLIIIPFTKDFAQQSSLEFIENILIQKIGTHHLIIGYDHRFGRNREGSFEYLMNHPQNFPFSLEEIPRQDVDNIGVSSTKIRESLKKGDILTTNNYLGTKYSLSGKVVAGEQNGRKIGFPTANIELIDDFKLIPQKGVYAVEIIFENKIYQGMLNIGNRPTLNGKSESIEVNIFDFTQDIYHQEMMIKFLAYIRNEQRFSSLEELQQQLEKDKQSVLSIIA